MNRQWTNSSVRKIVGDRDPVDAITELARDVVFDALEAGWGGPPFDPILLAKHLRLDVVPSDDVREARTVPAGGSKLRIEFNPNRPRRRVRYSESGGIDRPTLQHAMKWVRKDFQVLLKRGTKLADDKSATFCQNLLDLEPALWTFLRCEGVEPTNNHAERILRTGVLWRKRSFGSRSERGARFAERILTVVQTRRLQGKPVFPFLVEAIAAYRSGRAAPSLCSPASSPSLVAA